MATFSATAENILNLGYTLYGSADWKRGIEDGACQGAYNGSSINDSRVGFIRFSGAGEALNGSDITEITLTLKLASAGHDATDRVLTLRKSNYQTMPTTQKGSAVFGSTLGTLTGKFYNNTRTFTLNASTNAALFAAMKIYFQSGNSALVVYNGEWQKRSGGSTSYNYLRITSASISVTYTEVTTKPCGREWINGAWRKYELYTYNGGKWTLRVVRDGATIKPDELIYVTYPAAAMTSNSSQGCVASASSTYSSNYPIWRAFDNEETYSWASNTDTGTQWIQLKIPQALKRITVEVHSRTHDAIANPVSGTVQGSNNGTTWTQIGTYSGWSGIQQGGKLGEIVCNNETAYSYIRLTITERSTNGYKYVAIGYITITGGVPAE